MQEKKTSVLFRIIKGLVRLIYPKIRAVGVENLPDEPVIIVGNHCQMNGPIVGELYVPGEPYIWCAGEMMHRADVPEYAFRDFWSQKPKWTHPMYRLLAHIITPFSVCVFNNARTIGVYRDQRVMTTFRETVSMLKEGRNILIFPERNERDNNILYKFDENFVDVARLYYKKTGEKLTFVPMYIAPYLKESYIGEGIEYNPENDPAEERSRICSYISAAITKTARELPEHTVVPYRNIGRRHYLKNTDVNEVPR
jgi:hypothetical protein